MNPQTLRTIGMLLMAVGFGSAVYFFAFFDTSMEVPKQAILGQTFGGERVNNLGLMADRQNGLILSCVVALAGVMMFVASQVLATRAPVSQPSASGSPRRVTGGLECPRCRLISPIGAERCDCGFRFT